MKAHAGPIQMLDIMRANDTAMPARRLTLDMKEAGLITASTVRAARDGRKGNSGHCRQLGPWLPTLQGN
jgi:hypothetical protein